MYMESPLLSRGLQATSTPSIGAGSHRDLGSHQDTLDVSGINGIVMDDDVFKEADEGVHVVPESSLCENGQDLSSAAGVELHGGGSKDSLSTDQTPLRSACSVSRGSNKSGGPVKSLFLAGGEEFSSSGVNTSRAGENELNSDDPDFSQDITVDVQCICGSNLVTESQLIQCVHCLHYLHTDCVNLGDTAIAEVEQGLGWFCPACHHAFCGAGPVVGLEALGLEATGGAAAVAAGLLSEPEGEGEVPDDPGAAAATSTPTMESDSEPE